MAANVVRTAVLRDLLCRHHAEIDESIGGETAATTSRMAQFQRAIDEYASAVDLPGQLHGLRPISTLYSDCGFSEEATVPKRHREYEGRSAQRLGQSVQSWGAEPDPPNVAMGRQKWAIKEAEAQAQREAATRALERSGAVVRRYRLLQERVSSRELRTVAWGAEETALFEALLDGEQDVAERSSLLRSALVAIGQRNAAEDAEPSVEPVRDAEPATAAADDAAQWGKNERALLHAAGAGDHTQVEALLKGGADPDAPRADGQTPLLKAAACGHAMVLQQLLAAGAAVDKCSRCGCTALLLAAEKGQAAVLRALVKAGADPMLRGTGGAYWNLSACDIAERRGDADCAALLREAALVMRLVRRTNAAADRHASTGEDADSGSAEALTDLREPGHEDEPSEAGEDDSEQLPPPAWEETPDGQLYAAVTESCARRANPIDHSAADALEDAVGALLDSRADPNVSPPYCGLTVLMRASACGQTGVVARLLAADGCEVNQQTKSGATALMLAGRANRTSALKLLVEAGADLSLRMTSGIDAGKNALDLAVQEGRIESELLLRVAPDVDKMAAADAEAQANRAAKEKRLAMEMFDIWMQSV